MTTLDDPCFLTSFGTVCFVLKNVLITGSWGVHFFLERLRPIHSTVWIPSQHTAAMQYACHQPGGAVRFKW
jgi:hypothetical protein